MKKAPNINHGWQTQILRNATLHWGQGRSFCGDCVNFSECSKVTVKNAKEDTDYCLWGQPSRFKAKDSIFKAKDSIPTHKPENSQEHQQSHKDKE